MSDDPPALRNLSVYLFKDLDQVLEDYLDEEKLDDLTELELRDGLPFEGLAYYRPPDPSETSWADFLVDGLEDEDLTLESGSPSAVLVLRPDDRVFGIPWGTAGRFFFDRDLALDDFGLKVALNSVAPDKIRSTDSQQIDEASMYRREQASQALSFDEFAFDASRMILQEVTGKPRNRDLARQVTGKSHLRVKTRVEFEDLAEKCAQLLERYQAEDYKEDFPWLDSLSSVNDEERIEELDEVLLEALRERDLADAHMAPPEVVNWAVIDWFVYPNQRAQASHVEEPDLGECLDAIGEGEDLDVDDLNRKKLRVKWSYNNEPTRDWSIYDTIVFECTANGDNFVLSDGKWFQVETDFVEAVNEEVGELTTSDLPLPSAESGEKEAEYNERAAQASDDWILMDQRLCKPTQAVSRIEVCDLLTKDQEFVHVKKRRGSQTLSHLFNQGTVSAETFISDESFRQEARENVVELDPDVADQIKWDFPQDQDIGVVYAVIGEEEKVKPTGLPFFAKVNLTHALRTLTPLQCDVEFAPVVEVEA